MNLVRRVLVGVCLLGCAADVWGAPPRFEPNVVEIADARAILASVRYTGGEEVGLTLYPRTSCLGTVRGFERLGWGAVSNRLPSSTWADAAFPMELSYLIDGDDLADRLVLTLVGKELADDDFPPHFAAYIDASICLTAAPLADPNLTLQMTSRTFIHPQFETLHTPHGVEVLHWEDHPGMRGNDFHGLTVWTMRPSGVFERTFGPVVSENVHVLDVDGNLSEEIIVHGTSGMSHLAGSYYWLSRLPYAEDILTWDGQCYSRAPASVAHPYVRDATNALLEEYRIGSFSAEATRLYLLEAIETCLYWGVTDLGMEILDQHEAALRAPGVIREFAKGVDSVIARWRAGAAVAGYAYAESGDGE
jgi:hypothetical protein